MADELLPAAGPVKHNLNSPVELLLSLKQGTPAAEATESHQEDQASSPGSSTNPTIDEHHDSQSPTSDKHMTENARDNASSTASTSSGSETDLPSSSNESATKGNENDEEYIPPASRPVNASIGAKRPSALSKPVGRNNLPKDVTAKLKTWFFDHADHPYPNEEKKMLLAQDCDLTIMQINNWFINARRRLINRPPKRGTAEPASTTVSLSTTSSHSPPSLHSARSVRVKASQPHSHGNSSGGNTKSSEDEDPSLNADSSSGSDKASSNPSSDPSSMAAAAVPQLMAQVSALKDQLQQQQLQLLQQQAVIQAMKTQQALMPNAMMMPGDMGAMYNRSMLGNFQPPTTFASLNSMSGVGPMPSHNTDALAAFMSLQRMGPAQGALCTSQPTTMSTSFASPFGMPSAPGYDVVGRPLGGLNWQTQAGFQGPFSGQPQGKRAKISGSSNASSSGGSSRGGSSM